MSDGGGLYVCATPIGNLDDVSERLRRTLADVDLIYAEDTRRTATLLGRLGLRTPCRSLFAGNEKARTTELVGKVASGMSVAIVSDAGMPAISDPGSEAVRRVRELGRPVVVIPGPSAVTTAVALSGFSGDRFSFEGFLPRKGRDRASRIGGLVTEDRPVVVFASPNRLLGDITDLAREAGGDRRVVITRELTKLHEEVWEGTLSDAVAVWAEREPKGEFTIVLEPQERRVPSLVDAVAVANSQMERGLSASAAARQAAEVTGVSRRLIYEKLISNQG